MTEQTKKLIAFVVACVVAFLSNLYFWSWFVKWCVTQ